MRLSARLPMSGQARQTYLFLSLHIRSHRFDSVAALDNIGLEGDRAWAAMQLEEQAAGIAQHRAVLIAAP